jgi:hypothetical protein
MTASFLAAPKSKPLFLSEKKNFTLAVEKQLRKVI